MALLHTLSFAALLAFTGLGVASCLSPPDYPDTPEISFKSIATQRLVRPSGTLDTISITVSFKDGDGDLGLDDSETNPPYSELDASGRPNKYYNNYFITPQVRNTNGQFEDLQLGGFNYNSRYPRLTPEAIGDRKAPLRGDLTFGLVFGQGSFAPGTAVRFRVAIADRALNESNEVTTDPVVLP